MKHIFDKSAFEHEEEHESLHDYHEENLDECYEFGGTDEDKRGKKSLRQDLIDALPFLLIVAAFCTVVIYYSFNK